MSNETSTTTVRHNLVNVTQLVARTLEFDTGHRLLKHEGKCRNYHGHRYKAEIIVTTLAGLDHVGRVVDFGVIKAKVGGWIDEHWDHAMVLEQGDPLIPFLKENNQRVFVVENAPTAENLAEILFVVAANLLNDSGLRVVRVALWETPNCRADYVCTPVVMR